MGNELQEQKQQNNAVQKTTLSNVNQVQVKLINEIEKTAEEIGTQFSDYGKRCMVNAYAALVAQTKSQGISMDSLDGAMLRLAFQNIGYTELNFAALPSECYFDLRKYKDSNGVYHHSVAIKPQGAGNEKLTRTYGVKVKNLLPCWLIREGDDYTLPYWDGVTMTQPSWKPKSFDGKVILVIYPLEKTDGRTEFLIASREGVKPNIVSQIRQNALYAFRDENARDKFYRELDDDAEKYKVDDLIRLEKYRDYLSPTYLSFGSREQMIIRKMQNNALKNYPKEYDSSAMRNAVESMSEDIDDSIKEKPGIFNKDVVATVEGEITTDSKEPPLADFEIKEDGSVEESKEDTNKQAEEVSQECDTGSAEEEPQDVPNVEENSEPNYEDEI